MSVAEQDLLEQALAKIRDPSTSPERMQALIDHPMVQAYVKQVRAKTHGSEGMEDDEVLGAGPSQRFAAGQAAETEADRKKQLGDMDAAGQKNADDVLAWTKKLPGWVPDFMKGGRMGIGAKTPEEARDRATMGESFDPKKSARRTALGDKRYENVAAAQDTVARVEEPLTSAGMGLFLGPGGSLISSLAKGAAAAAAGPYAKHTMQGDDPATAAKAAALPALFGGAVGLASGVPKALRNPESAIGGEADTIATLDEMRGRGAISKNRTFRTVNDPELAALPKGKPGYYKAAQGARNTLSNNASDDLAAARKEYADGLAAVERDVGDKLHPTDGIMQRMGALREENMVNGVAVDEKLNAALDKVGSMMKRPTGIVSKDGREITAPEATVGEILKIKRGVDKLADWGMPATPETRPYRLIAKDLAQEAETIDPRIGPMNQKYHSSMSKLEETNDILYGKDAPAVADRSAGRRQAAGKLARVGDDTAAGSLAQEDLDHLAAGDPRAAEAIRPIREKKALERTRFGLPQISRSPEKWGGSLLEQNLGAGGARVLDPLMSKIAALRGMLGPAGTAVAPQMPDAAEMIRKQLWGQPEQETP